MTTAAAPALLRTPLYDRAAAAGARFVAFAGYELPRDFGSILEEHKAVREGAALFDVSHMARFRIERTGRLDARLSRPVSDLPPGRARYALFLTPEATVLDDFVAFRAPDGPLYLVSNAARRGVVAGALAEAEACFVDGTERSAMLALQGPRAAEVVERVAKEAARLRRFHVARITTGPLEGALVARTGYTGEDGFEFIVSDARAEAAWETLLAAGGPGFVRPAGLGARDLARLEAALPLYGADLDDTVDPEEAGLSFALEEGRGAEWEEALALRRRGRRRRRAGLVLASSPAARGGEVVRDVNGKAVGRVTSGAPSPIVGAPIALALVASQAEPASVEVRGRAIAAREVPLPFVGR